VIASFIFKLLIAAAGAVSSFAVATLTKNRLKKSSEREFEIRASSGGKILGNFKADISDRTGFEAKATEALQLVKDKVGATSSKSE
jgi:hypothetical protein